MSENLSITSPEIALIWAAAELTKAWLGTSKIPQAPSDIAKAFRDIHGEITTIVPKSKSGPKVHQF